jgi:hypothetical protein
MDTRRSTACLNWHCYLYLGSAFDLFLICTSPDEWLEYGIDARNRLEDEYRQHYESELKFIGLPSGRSNRRTPMVSYDCALACHGVILARSFSRCVFIKQYRQLQDGFDLLTRMIEWPTLCIGAMDYQWLGMTFSPTNYSSIGRYYLHFHSHIYVHRMKV